MVVVGVILGWGVWYFGLFERLINKTSSPTVQNTDVPAIVQQFYTSENLGVALSYPSNYTVNGSYAYDQFGQEKLIHGVSFTVPASMTTGTNLSGDTKISIEQLPRAVRCTGDIFLLDDVKAVTIQEATTTYSVASTTGAAAGNRYEEVVYAIAGSKPCTAVRYFVRYSSIENYPEGTVAVFDRAALISSFDTIRRSLVLTTQ